MPLDADIAAFLEKVGPNGFDELLPDGPGEEKLERTLQALRGLPVRPVDPADPVATRDAASADGVRVRLYSVAEISTPAPVVVFLHGGGWVLGDLDTHDHLCRAIARGRLLVVSVDYRLAPEHPFPAPLDDLRSALDWVAEEAAGFGGDPAKIVPFGISSGANLAAALTLRELLEGTNRVAAQVLAYPVLDSRMGTRSHRENSSGYHLTAKQIAWFWDQYVPVAEDRSHPLASLAHAKSVAGLPPTVVLTAEYDVLRDEGDEFARRLDAAGVGVEHVEVPGAIHGFLAMDPKVCAAATPALDDLIARIKRLTAAESESLA